MEYIVVDFEWNQSAYGKNASNKHIPFEIIEIGAVKLSADGENLGQFNEVIKPKIYKKLHHVTKCLTGITEKELNHGKPFPEVFERFMEWCGESFMFCTWGNLDLLELQRNVRFYHLEHLLKGPITYYNVQKLFRMLYSDGHSSSSLEHAVQYLDIETGEDFHRAINDAKYTAEIFVGMDPVERSKWYTVDYYENPKKRKEEIKLIYPNYSKYISKEYESKERAMEDREVRSTRCFYCGKTALKRIRWFVGKNKAYYCLAECAEHGYLRCKIRLKKTDAHKVYVVKTLRSTDMEGAQKIAEMKEELRQKRLEKRHREAGHEG